MSSAADDLAGPRMELFSMLAMAAVHEMGVALMPRLLIEDELARAELIVACDRVLDAGRAYYLVVPERRAGHPGVACLREWLLEEAAR